MVVEVRPWSGSLALNYWEPNTALTQMLFWRKIFEDGKCLSPGLFAAPFFEFPELSLISYEM
jgi:hypothetical protein